MTTPELKPLDPDVLALLAHEKPVAELDGARKAAILAAVTSKLGPVPPDGGGGGGEGTSGPAPGGTAAAASAGGAKAAIALAATFALGVAAGVVGDRTLAERPAQPVASVATPPPVRAPDAVPPATEVPGVPVTALPSVATTARATTSAAAAPPPSARGLAAERALLDVARSSLARGEAREALAAADRHAATYPDGALVEEREAIAIKALVALGRRDEARGRARELERKYPNSLVLRAVKNAVEEPP